jgi:hypothetical protein
MSFVNDTFSTIPRSPIVVVKIKMMGPISASELLMIMALSMELNLNIKKAANNSMLPEINLNKAIPRTAFSINANIKTSPTISFSTIYDALSN